LVDNDNDDSGFEIGDVENYGYGNKESFNHQVLVMVSIRQCIDAGNGEMRSGYTNVRTDKQGNEVVSYVEDTRKKFIQTVKLCRALMSCDFDKDAKKIFPEILEELNKIKGEYLKQQSNWWKGLNPREKKEAFNNKHQIMEGRLNKNLPIYEFYIDEEVDIYLKIFEELNKLTERIGFYEVADFEN